MVTYIMFSVGAGLLGLFAGGQLGATKLPKWLTWLPEALLAVLMSYVCSPEGLEWLAVPVFYIMFQSGHADGYHMGRHPEFRRQQTLTPIVEFIFYKILRGRDADI